MGYTDSINYGMITSITECEDVDGEYKVIATDMAASDMSYGFLLNLDGNMVGIVAQKFKQTGAADTLTALGISDISYLLEMLAAGRSLPIPVWSERASVPMWQSISAFLTVFMSRK